MATDEADVHEWLPDDPVRTFLGIEVWIVFVFFLLSLSADASTLPGWIVSLPAFLVLASLDLVDNVLFSLGDAFYPVLVVVYYLVSVAVVAAYREYVAGTEE